MLRNQMGFGDHIVQLFNEPNQKYIMNITFQVTENCNLKCSYCYQNHKTQQNMSFETAKSFIDYLFANKTNPNFLYNKNNCKGFVIDFIGGEPLLEIELIEQIVEYFEQHFLQDPDDEWLYTHCYNISTNGTLYHSPNFQKFLKKYRSLCGIGVTLDGNEQLHNSCRKFPDGTGSYSLALKAALEELKYGYNSTKITISPNNVNYIFDGIKNMILLGFKFININCCFEDVWNRKDAIEVFNQLKKTSDWIKENNLYNKIFIAMLNPSTYTPIHPEDYDKNWCGVGAGGMLAIDYKGIFYPCIRFMPSSLGNTIQPITLGNIKDGFLSNDNEKNNYKKLCNCTRKSLSNDNCLKCPISAGCSWCLGYSYEYYNNLEQKTNFICEQYKMAALATKYLCKIMNDKKNFDLIQLNYNMYNDLISLKDFEKINEWKEAK